jgi:apolipoprotein N-acyltransferase
MSHIFFLCKKSTPIWGSLLSLSIVALGQPARIGWLSAAAAIFGFSLFFNSLSPSLSLRQKFFAGTGWFTAIQLIQLSWMTSIEFQGYYILFVYILVALGLGCQFGLLTMVVPNDGQITLKKILLCAALWTLMEWARLWFFCGFSWNPIGLALTHFIPSLQFSSIFGILGLSFWVMLTNLLGLNALRSRVKNRKTVYSTYALYAFIAGIPYFFGVAQLYHYRHGNEMETKTLDVALIQTDLLPSEKTPHVNRIDDFISPFEQWERILKFLKEKEMSHWDLIVLPEAALPMPADRSVYLYDEAQKVLISAFGPEAEKKFPPLCPPYAEQRHFKDKQIWCVSNLYWCQALSNLFEAEVIAGLDYSDLKGKKNFNSAFYLKANGRRVERYDKQILLPLAESLPYPFLRPLTRSYGITDFFSQGEGTKIFGEKILFSPSICYEETFSELMREGKVNGAELFVNMTNDNYFPHSYLHEQHLYHARLRAVENGIPLIRACNSGVTAVIDCFGRVLATFDKGGIDREKQGVLKHHLIVFHFPTLFSFWGEGGIVSLCLIIFLYNWTLAIGGKGFRS